MYFERLLSAKVAISECEKVDYAVFDDNSINHMPGWKSWFGSQPYIGLRQLHRDAVYVKWGKPIIWACNRDPRIDMRININDERSHQWFQDDIDWMEANCIFVEVSDPLVTFRANTE